MKEFRKVSFSISFLKTNVLQEGLGQPGPLGSRAKLNVLNVYAFWSHIPKPKSVS